MYLQALIGFEKLENPEHTSMLVTISNLGNLYSNQGKLKEAEGMYLRALTGYEKVWGSEHTSTLVTTRNLGKLYSKQGKMKEAEDTFLRTLTGKARGPESEPAFTTRFHLGLLYKKRSMFEKAIQQFELVVQGNRKLLGPEHSATVMALKQVENCKSRLEEKKEVS